MMQNTWNRRILRAASPILIAASYPSLAQAHVGAGPIHSLADGFIHPLTGLDHLAAMLAVGLWAAQLGGRAIWLMPTTFVAMLMLGGIMGIGQMPLPFVEPAIVASIIVLGLSVSTAVSLPMAAGAIVAGMFAVFHGHAHGTEMPLGSVSVAYGLGILGSSAVLLLLGIAFGLAARHANLTWSRYAGGAIAACGIYLCVA